MGQSRYLVGMGDAWVLRLGQGRWGSPPVNPEAKIGGKRKNRSMQAAVQDEVVRSLPPTQDCVCVCVWALWLGHLLSSVHPLLFHQASLKNHEVQDKIIQKSMMATERTTCVWKQEPM